MYDGEFHFITFILFLGLLSGFGFESVMPEPDPIGIRVKLFRSKPVKFVNGWIGFSGTIYSPNFLGSSIIVLDSPNNS